MVARGVRPNEFTFTFVLPACAGGRRDDEGRKIHEAIQSMGMESNSFVATALVDMYGKCGLIVAAGDVFDRMQQRGMPYVIIMRVPCRPLSKCKDQRYNMMQ